MWREHVRVNGEDGRESCFWGTIAMFGDVACLSGCSSCITMRPLYANRLLVITTTYLCALSLTSCARTQTGKDSRKCGPTGVEAVTRQNSPPPPDGAPGSGVGSLTVHATSGTESRAKLNMVFIQLNRPGPVPDTAEVRRGFTSDSGDVRLDSIPPGQYALHIRRIGSPPINRRIEIRAGGSDTLSVRMRKAISCLEGISVANTKHRSRGAPGGL